MLKMQVIGRLGQDSRVNQVQGRSVINFSVAVDEKKKDGSKITKWISVAYWPQSTALAPYLKKGTLIYVEGAPDIEVYNEKAGLKLTAFQVQLLGGQQSQGSNQQQQSQTQPQATNAYDDLPF